jgi:hypothetical protein
MNTANDVDVRADRRDYRRGALYIAAGAGAVWALVAIFAFATALYAYLVAYLFWLGVGLGSLALLMVQHLSGGAWGLVIRRVLEAATRTLPLFGILFLPVVFGLDELYTWANPQRVEHDPLLEHKQLYLNVPFFLVRALVYFVTWLGLAHWLNRWSREQDETSGAEVSGKFRGLSALGLLLYGLTITFASIDWAMSLEPHWFSTIYGMLFGIGQVLSAFTLAVAVVTLLASEPPFVEVLKPSHLGDLGGLLLAFVMLWAYVSFSQFLLIWSGDLPEETTWYLHRLEGGWQVIGLSLILLHFAVPLLLLLSRPLKQNARSLRWVAIGVFVMRMVDMCWLIMPAASHGESSRSQTVPIAHLALCAVALVGLGGVWCAKFLVEFERRPRLPIHDPAFAGLSDHD